MPQMLKALNNRIMPMLKCWPPLFQRLVILLAFSSFLTVAKRAEFTIELKNHLFFPAEIEIPEDTKVKLIIYNRDQTPEEFDSFDLNREKVIFPEKRAVIFIGPLPSGRYEFFGEFNPNSAKGAIIVVPNVSLQSHVSDEVIGVNSAIAWQESNAIVNGVSHVN